MTREDEFYVGYERHLPGGYRRAVGAALAFIFVALVAAAVTFTAAERPLARSSFAFGEPREWSGYLLRDPAPSLMVPTATGFDRHWLVARGKHGAAGVIGHLENRWVSVRGSAIEREPWRMIEISSLAFEPVPAGTPEFRAQPGTGERRATVHGEIVDSKCYLGVMNPGERIAHRDCAERCLSGGITPMFAFTDEGGARSLAVLVSPDGTLPIVDLRGRVGRPVHITGTFFSIGDITVLRLDSPPGA